MDGSGTPEQPADTHMSDGAQENAPDGMSAPVGLDVAPNSIPADVATTPATPATGPSALNENLIAANGAASPGNTPLAVGTPGTPSGGATHVREAHASQLDPTLANKLHIIPPANEQGSPTRVYVNTKVTPWLLEGMKWVAANEPEKPLKWLGEYLLKKSAEVEGT